MNSRPCDALHEIQIGCLSFESFAPPEVFVRGVYDQYGVTVADLRWHLPCCDICAVTSGARDQLADFDRVRFEKLIKLLGRSQESLQECLQRGEGHAEAFGSMTADEFVGKQEGQGYSREDVFEANK